MKRANGTIGAVVAAMWLVAGALTASAEATLFYLRHAEGGHNVKADYVKKGIPQSEWPSYVGNQNVFTPKGVEQAGALATNLLPFHFDLIAVSPLWRTRNTILPYLRATGQKAEIWPELLECPFMGDTSPAAQAKVDRAVLEGKDPVELTAEEKSIFHFRANSVERLMAPTNAAQAGLLAVRTGELLRERIGTNDMTVLLVGHGTAGLTLVRYLAPDKSAAHHMGNTHLWLASYMPEGGFKLKYHDLSATEAAKR